MSFIKRNYPNSNIVDIILLLSGLLAGPLFVIVLFGKWAESPMRQVVGFSALLGIWGLAFIKKRHEALCLAIIFCSQFKISLASFALTDPVIQPIFLFDILLIILVMQFFEIGEKLTINRNSGIGWIFLAFITWQILITPFSAHLDRSISFSVSQATYLLLYLIVSNLSFDEIFYRRLPWVICAILLIQTAIASVQLAKGGYVGLAVLGEFDPSKADVYYFQGVLRAAGTLGATNGLGGYLAATLVFLTPFLLAQFNIIRFSIFFLGLIGIIIPLSRAGWLSLLIGGAIVTFQMFRSKLINPAKIMILGLIAVLMLSSVAYVKWDLIAERFSNKAAQASAEGRVGQFPYAWAMSMKNPISGIGPGISSFYGSWNDFDKYIQHEDKTKEVRFNEQVHSSFLQYLLESGLPGAILFSCLVISALLNALKRVSRNKPQQLIRMGAAAAAFTCLLHTQFGTEINSQQLLTFFAFTLGISTNKYLLGQPANYREVDRNVQIPTG